MTDLSVWPALILTAGRATRLRPLSLVRAKGAMPVAGKPIIIRILEWLRAAGIRRVVINLHHRPETITRLTGDGSQCDLQVRYSWERVLLGSAGGPRRALPLLESDRFLIVNGDTLTNCDLKGLVARHQSSGACVTMAVVPGDVERYGGVQLRSDGTVAGFSPGHARSESPTRTSRAIAPLDRVRTAHFIGVQAVDARAFEGVSDDQPSETVRTLYPRLLAAKADAIAAFESDAEFLDVGTARDYLETVKTVAAREGVPLDRGDSVRVDASAVVSETILWDRVSIGANARLVNCVVADEVEVADGARYERAALVSTPDGVSVSPL